jgi:hypothetical protein
LTNAAVVEVTAGDVVLSGILPVSITVKHNQWRIHRNFDEIMGYNDIALIQLPTNMPNNEKIRIGHILFRDFTRKSVYDEFANRQFQIVGYIRNTDTYLTTMQYKNVALGDVSTCESSPYFDYMYGNKFCVTSDAIQSQVTY